MHNLQTSFINIWRKYSHKFLVDKKYYTSYVLISIIMDLKSLVISILFVNSETSKLIFN